MYVPHVNLNMSKYKLYKKKYNRTLDGFFVRTYDNQVSHSKSRGHQLPKYTKKELRDWVLSQENFIDLWNCWVKSNYDRWKKPSVDRINDSLSYSLENIRLVTWKENSMKESRKRSLPIIQIKNNKIIRKFKSAVEAEKITNINRSSINACCRGVRKSAGGYNWDYFNK